MEKAVPCPPESSESQPASSLAELTLGGDGPAAEAPGVSMGMNGKQKFTENEHCEPAWK